MTLTGCILYEQVWHHLLETLELGCLHSSLGSQCPLFNDSIPLTPSLLTRRPSGPLKSIAWVENEYFNLAIMAKGAP